MSESHESSTPAAGSCLRKDRSVILAFVLRRFPVPASRRPLVAVVLSDEGARAVLEDGTTRYYALESDMLRDWSIRWDDLRAWAREVADDALFAWGTE